MSASPEAPEPRRLLVELTERTGSQLDAIEVESETNKSIAVNRAVNVYAIARGLAGPDGEVRIVGADGTTARVKVR
jgi:hypothetical protein